MLDKNIIALINSQYLGSSIINKTTQFFDFNNLYGPFTCSNVWQTPSQSSFGTLHKNQSEFTRKIQTMPSIINYFK